MNALILVALGGAVGAVARFGVVSAIGYWGFHPWGTWVVNVVGCFAIGAVVGAYGTTAWFQQYAWPLLVVGVLGAFTTFSAFSLDAWNLVSSGKPGVAALYVLASVALCLGGAWLGLRSFGG